MYANLSIQIYLLKISFILFIKVIDKKLTTT